MWRHKDEIVSLTDEKIDFTFRVKAGGHVSFVAELRQLGDLKRHAHRRIQSLTERFLRLLRRR
jgi:hypothetical protein